MVSINQFEVSSLLHSELVGQADFGQGQIGSLGDAQRFVDMMQVEHSPGQLHGHGHADIATVRNAFLAVRNARGDNGSPDLYVADPIRNAELIKTCRAMGLTDSAYIINKTLFYMRKNSHLKGLGSKRTSIDYDSFAFASEFAAVDIRYQTGATIDEMICDPALAARFDSIARKLAPGRTSFEYRWAILSIRKAGRHAEWKSQYRMPPLAHRFRIISDDVSSIPSTLGVYMLQEDSRPLYARATTDLRKGIQAHQDPAILRAISSDLWKPSLDKFVITYATLTDKKLLKPVEHKLIETEHPLFNVARAA